MPFSLLKNLFRKEKREAKKFLTVKEARPGQIVELRYHDPRSLGLQSPSGKELSITRFNHDELDGDRVIKGFVKKVGNWEGGPCYGWYIIVESKKGPVDREYLFLQEEVDWIREID